MFVWPSHAPFWSQVAWIWKSDLTSNGKVVCRIRWPLCLRLSEHPDRNHPDQRGHPYCWGPLSSRRMIQTSGTSSETNDNYCTYCKYKLDYFRLCSKLITLALSNFLDILKVLYGIFDTLHTKIFVRPKTYSWVWGSVRESYLNGGIIKCIKQSRASHR